MNECEVCPDNHISPEEGAALCTPCEAGKEPNSDQSACGKNSCRGDHGQMGNLVKWDFAISGKQ